MDLFCVYMVRNDENFVREYKSQNPKKEIRKTDKEVS